MTRRALGRNVYIYSARGTNTVLVGLSLTDGITRANSYSVVEIVFIFDNDYTPDSESGTTVQRDNHPLKAGKYLINTAGSLKVNNEPLLVQTRSVGAQAPAKEFRVSVRGRSYWGVITGQPALNAVYAVYGRDGYRAAPIFPLTHEQ